MNCDEIAATRARIRERLEHIPPPDCVKKPREIPVVTWTIGGIVGLIVLTALMRW